jgi:hypothetical protein
MASGPISNFIEAYDFDGVRFPSPKTSFVREAVCQDSRERKAVWSEAFAVSLSYNLKCKSILQAVNRRTSFYTEIGLKHAYFRQGRRKL